ncbi:hypothetical protein AAVH_02633 [Aphelenchoides avenae]|nr:hypothetical protein AAVH_02633 [Aphelenchus avenae]
MEEAAFACWPVKPEDFKRHGIALDETHWAMPQHTIESEQRVLPPEWHETPEWKAEADVFNKATARLYLRQHVVSEEEKKPAKVKKPGRVEGYAFVTDSYTGPLEVTDLASELDPAPLLSRPALAQRSSDEWACPIAPAPKCSKSQDEAVTRELTKNKLRARLHLRQTEAVPESTKASKRKSVERTAQYPVLTDPYVGTLELTTFTAELESLPLLSRPQYIAGELSEWTLTAKPEQVDANDVPPEWNSSPAWNEAQDVTVAQAEVFTSERPKNKLLARLHIRRTEEVSDPESKTKRQSLNRAAQYEFVTDAYAGPVEVTALTTEVEHVPLVSQPRENVIDSKEWSQPLKSDEGATKDLPSEWNVSPEWDEAQEVKVEAEPEPSMTTAHLYLRQEREAEAAEPDTKRKSKDATSRYPSTEPFEGPLSVIAPLPELEPSALMLEPRPAVVLDVSQWAVPSEPIEIAMQELPPEWNVTPEWNIKEEVLEPEEYRTKTTAVLNLKAEETREEALVKEEVEKQKQSEYPVIAEPYAGPIDVLAPVIEIETVTMDMWTSQRQSLPSSVVAVDEHWETPLAISQSPPIEWNKKPEWDVPRDEEAHQAQADARKCKAVLYLKPREVEPPVKQEIKKPKKVTTTTAQETPFKLTARIVVRERHEGEETVEELKLELYPSPTAFEGAPEALSLSAEFESSTWGAEQKPSTFSNTLLSRMSQSRMVVVRTFTMPKQQAAKSSTSAPPLQKATCAAKTEPYGGPVYFLDYSSDLPAEEVLLQVKNEPEEADEWATPSSSRWEVARDEPDSKPVGVDSENQGNIAP